jgi:predicted nucleotide-binding protein (sugar kinase/HSP70/actin superfamily)
MKVAFPHMGNAYISLSALLEGMGAEVVMPPRPTRKTIDLGALHAPEFVCLPFKVNLGDNIQALDMGADTLAMVSGMWACRFGYYGRVQHQILKDSGYEFSSILLGRDSLASVYNAFGGTAPGSLPVSWFNAIRAFRRKALAVDELEAKARRIRPWESSRGATTRALGSALVGLHAATGSARTRDALADGLCMLDAVELDRSGRRPLTVTILGELYVVLEPALNFDIERVLGEMGVTALPVLSVYRWLFRSLKVDPRITLDEKRASRLARPYIALDLGGEEHMTIAGTIRAARNGHDGVIHLYPFTCMPENICRAILPRLETEYDIPVLNLCLDEHASPAGVATRLEAFVDLLRQRRRRVES